MAKNTKAQEVSTGTSDSYTEDEVAGMSSTLRGRPMLGGELLSVGTSSSRSSGKEKTLSDNESPSHQAPAPTTENPSSATEPVTDSDANSTGGVGQTAETLTPSDKKIIKPAPPKKNQARVTSVNDDADFAGM